MLENSFAPAGAAINKISKGQIGIIVLAVAGIVGLRLIASRKINSAERLADALLDTDKLNEAVRYLPHEPESALASCAAYLVNVSNRAAAGQGVTGILEDPVNFSRTQRHPYTNGVTTVRTESHSPDHCLTYALTLPEIADVRGTRNVGSVRLSGLSPARPAPDTVQIKLAPGYTVQAQTEFEIADYLVTGQMRLYGSATIADNLGNVGRLHISFDGVVTGTVTRDAKIVGRFEGKVATGIIFRKYELPPDTTNSTDATTEQPANDPSNDPSNDEAPKPTVDGPTIVPDPNPPSQPE